MRPRPEAHDDGGDRATRAADVALTEKDAATGFQTRTERVADSTYIVSVTGEIDMYTGPAFSSALHGALDAGATQLIVDLSNCCFMDSTGIRILIGANQRLHHSGNPVAVVTGHPNVLPVLQITAVDTILRVHRSRSAALNGNGRA